MRPKPAGEGTTVYTKPEELVELFKDAVEEANARLRTGLFTFVLVSVFLCVAVLSTSHRDLLVGKVLRLPVVEVDLPITWFYVLAPLVYLALHLALLAQAVQAVQRLAHLAAALRLTGRKEDLGTGHRLAVWVLAPFSLVRQPDGPEPHALGRLPARMLGALPLTLVPLGLLFLFHQRFLAYQSAWVSALHILVIVADAVAIRHAWRRLEPALLDEVAKPASATVRAGLARSLRVVPYGSLAVALAWCGAVLLRPPFLEHWFRIDVRGSDLGAAGRAAGVVSIDEKALAERLAHMRTGALPLPTVEIVALVQEKVFSVAQRLDLRGRSLRGAKLGQAGLAGADLRRADLSGADLRFADLRDAVLDGADLSGADLGHARLHLADLTRAVLRKAKAPFAEFPGAVVHAADFTGADLRGAHLEFLRSDDPGVAADGIASGTRGATFYDADLTGAQLHGTDLGRFDLRHARLRDAQLHGATLPAPGPGREGVTLTGAVMRDGVTEGGRTRQILFVADPGGGVAAALCDKQPPNFSSVFHDAALIATEETWVPIMERIAVLRSLQEKPCGEPVAGAATAELGGP